MGSPGMGSGDRTAVATPRDPARTVEDRDEPAGLEVALLLLLEVGEPAALAAREVLAWLTRSPIGYLNPTSLSASGKR